MTDPHSHALERLMADCAASPEEKHRRRELLSRISDLGVEAEERWLAHLRFNERLRLELRRVEVSPQLADHLLEIPLTQRVTAESTERTTVARFRPMARLAAAAILLIIGVAILALFNRTDSEQGFAALASMAIADHLSAPALSIESTDEDTVVRALQPNISFAVQLKSPGSDSVLEGGRICAFETGPLIYTRWRHQAGADSMYQVRLGDFGLPPYTDRHVVESADPSLRVVAWSNDRFGFALVCTHTAEMSETTQSSERNKLTESDL